MKSMFLRLLQHDSKSSALGEVVDKLRNGEPAIEVYTVDPASFGLVPGSPFAYWVKDEVRRLFVEMPRLGSSGREIQVGASTKDDFRFVRAWWETPVILSARSREDTLNNKRWVPFAKGGAYYPYYA